MMARGSSRYVVAVVWVACALGLGCGRQASTEGTSRAAAALSGGTGSMAAPRSLFTATRLADGRVLVAGGTSDLLAPPAAQCELWDPATGTFTPAASMAAWHIGHVAALLPDGKVLVSGGRTGGPTGTAAVRDEIYDPVAGAWADAGSHVARYLPAAVTLGDGRVLVTGGADRDGYALPDVRLYDPSAGTWVPAPAMAAPRYGHTATVLADGRVLVAGGSGTASSEASLASAEIFDPASPGWTPAAPLATGRVVASATLLPDGRVLVAGGLARDAATGASFATAASELFDPATGAWSAAPPMLEARAWHRAVATASGQVLVLGGTGPGATLASVERFDPAAGTWAPAPPLLEPRARFAAVPLADGRVLVAGGEGASGSLASAEVYDPASCAPTTCAAVGATCGAVGDGCGGTLACGSCPAGFACSAANACVPVCAPATCAQLGKNCGTVADGCGGVLACGTCPAGSTCAANVCAQAATTAVYDATLRAPRCARGAACDSGVLLDGRGSLGPERNAPNTVNGSCADGSAGDYHRDESLDRLRVATLDGSELAAGKQVKIEATVWVWGSGYDRLDLYHAATASTPAWTLLATLAPAASGAQTLSTTISLPRGALQAIRGRFRYGGSAAPCGTGSYDDHDDLVFAVTTPDDLAPPTVAVTAPPTGATVTGTVVVAAAASDDLGIARVEFYADAAYLGADTSAPYTATWNTRSVANGLHTLTVKAFDLGGNSAAATAAVTTANDFTPPASALTAPAPGSTVAGTVTLAASASDDVGVARVDFLDGPRVIASASAPPYQVSWNTTSVANGIHALTSQAYDAAGNVGASQPVEVTVSNAGASAVQLAAYDPARRAPACATAGPGCDTGALVNGRAHLGPEPNQPNTLGGSCADGTAGGFHYDESLDRLRIVTVDGAPLSAGRTVRVEATVWAWSAGADRLDLYHAPDAASPAWALVRTLSPTASGQQTLSTTFVLPAGAVQAIRGVFRYAGTASPCGGGSYDDRDDLVFAVE